MNGGETASMVREEIRAMRADCRVICDVVEEGARVLDLGCGTGELIQALAVEKKARVQGIERDEESIYRCVEKGLSVFQSDIESGLADYPDRCFDYVILNQSIQEVRKIDFVVQEALRVGSRAIVGFPNFAYYGARFMLAVQGRAPVTASLPYHWYDTPNVRFLSIADFRDFCRMKSITVLAAFCLGDDGPIRFLPNLRALNAVFVITRSV